MTNESKSFLYRAYNPFLQAAIVFGAGLVIMIIGLVLQKTGTMKGEERFAWMIAAAFLLLFAIFNSIFGLSAKDTNKYWLQSIVSFALLAAGSGLMAWFFSSIPIGQAGSYSWIFKVVTFGYLVFISIIGLIKRIVEFAEKEEWNQPRPRKKK